MSKTNETWQPDWPFQEGCRVRTADTLDQRDFTEAGHRIRWPNKHGIVEDFSDAHGLCFRVEYEDGGYGYLDPDELTKV